MSVKLWRKSPSVYARREFGLIEIEYVNFYKRMSLVLCASLTSMDVINVPLLMEEEAEECALLQEFVRQDTHMLFRKRREVECFRT